jgi:hypothetical protein
MKAKLSSILLLVSCYLLPSPVYAWEGDKGDVPTIKSLEGLFENILGIVLSLVGLVTFIMILVGGFKYLTSGGDPKQTEAAKATLTSGIIGLALTIGAWFILLAIKGFTGVPLTDFTIGLP